MERCNTAIRIIGSAPLGAFVLIFAVNDASSSILADNSPVIYVATLGAITGLIADLLYRGLNYTADRPGQFCLFACYHV